MEKNMYLATNATAVLLHQPYLDDYFIMEINIEQIVCIRASSSKFLGPLLSVWSYLG